MANYRLRIGFRNNFVLGCEAGGFTLTGQAVNLIYTQNSGSGFAVPTIQFSGLTPTTHDMRQYVVGYNAAFMSLVIQGTTLPASVTFNGTHLVYAGSASVVEVTGIKLVVISDAENTSVPPIAIQNLQGGNWLEIQNTRIRTVLPAGPTGNPVNIIEAWSGGCIDTFRQRYIIWGGGHNDYNGNEVYAIDFSNSSVSRITQNTFTNPVSRHTYGAMSYVAHADKVYSSGGATSPNGSVDRTTWLLNLATDPPTWTNDADTTPMQVTFGSISKYDSITQLVYVYDRDFLYTYNLTTGNYTLRGTGPSLSLDASDCIDTLRRRFVLIDGGSVSYINLDSPYSTGTISALNGNATTSLRSPGIDYDPIHDRLVLWAGGNTVYSLPAAGGSWRQDALNIGPAASQTSTGTYGRWGYIPAYNVFALVNSIDQNAFVFRMP